MRRAAGPALAGAGVLASGWALGSTPLALAGGALLAAGVLALAWTLLAHRARVVREVERTVLVEDEPLRISYALRRARVLPGRLELREDVGPTAAKPVTLHRRAPNAVVVRGLPRGVHRVGPGLLTADDPLGLVRHERPGPDGPVVRVRPRIALLGSTFRERAGAGAGGRRRASLRLAGGEPQGVREYREGESLRAIHWVSSARRGRLMVRELEDAPRDELVVVLDLDASGDVGEPGSSSLDESVRVAGSLVRAEAARGRRAGLVLAGHEPLRVTVGSLGDDWEAALDALTGAHGVRSACTAALLRAGRERGLVLVTARPASVFADPLLRHGSAAIVAVDAPSYAGQGSSAADPSLLRLAAHGVPVAVVRAGDELADVLGARIEAARA